MATFGAFDFPGLLGAGLERHGICAAARLVGVFEDVLDDPGAVRRTLTELVEVELGSDDLDWYADLLRESWGDFQVLADKEAQRAARTPSLQCALQHVLRGREAKTRPAPVPAATSDAPQGGFAEALAHNPVHATWLG